MDRKTEEILVGLNSGCYHNREAALRKLTATQMKNPAIRSRVKEISMNSCEEDDNIALAKKKLAMK